MDVKKISAVVAAMTALCISTTAVSVTAFADEDGSAVSESAVEETAVTERSDSSEADESSVGDSSSEETSSAEETEGSSSVADEFEADESVSAEDTARRSDELPKKAQVLSKTMTTAVVRITPKEGAVRYELYSRKQDRIVKEVTAEEAQGDILLTELIPQYSQPIKVTTYFEDGTSMVTESFNVTTSGIKKATDLTVYDRTHSMTEKCSASLKWTRSPGVDGYIVCDAQTNEEITRVSGEYNTSVTLKGLETGSDKRVYIQAYVNSYGKEYRGLTSNRTWIHCFPQNTTMTVTSYNTESITVSLTHSKGADGYYLYCSTDGKDFYKAATLVGEDNLKGKITGLSPLTTYYIKAVPYRKYSNIEYLGSYTVVKTLTTAEYKTTTCETVIYPSAAYGETTIGTVPNGKKVLYFGAVGRWAKIRVGGVDGYIYNKSLGVTSNGTLTGDMEAYIDDLLFDIGPTPKNICLWVNTHCYYMNKGKGGKDRDKLAYEMFLYRYGSCYYYSAACDYMLERAGYSHKMIIGQSGYGEHGYNEYVTSKGTLYLDACPFNVWNCVPFYDWTWEQVKAARPGYTK